MRYMIGVLALIVSFGAIADITSFKMRAVVVESINYDSNGIDNVRFVDRPFEDVCGREFGVIWSRVEPLELSVVSDALLDLRIFDLDPERSGGCQIVNGVLKKPAK